MTFTGKNGGTSVPPAGASADPLPVVWDALERADCNPHGVPHNFRARCPGHNGENPNSLHVHEGADRRVLLHCFAHRCRAEWITAAIGLTVADLFPAGHRRARRQRPAPVRRSDLTGNAQHIANVLAALDLLALPWTAMVGCDCPYCGSPGAWLRATSAGDYPLVDCPEGCTVDEITGALAARTREGNGR